MKFNEVFNEKLVLANFEWRVNKINNFDNFTNNSFLAK